MLPTARRQIVARLHSQLNRPPWPKLVAPFCTLAARAQRHGVVRIFYDDGAWIHETRHGFFAYLHPYIRLDLSRFEYLTRHNFFWGYKPRPGDTIVDIGAGVGEEAATFSHAVGPRGQVICVEAHPRTFRCLEKLIHYNQLRNVTALHCAIAEPDRSEARIEDSDAYLANRLQSSSGIAVPAITLDALYQQLELGRIDFLKMNIEGAERLAIQAMSRLLAHTAIACISCHDFLVPAGTDNFLRTKSLVQQFLLRSGFSLATRSGPGVAPYLCDQVWAFNAELLAKTAS